MGSGLGLDDIDGALLVLGVKLRVVVGLFETVGEFVGAVLIEGISLLVNVGMALIDGAELTLG